MPIMGQDVKYLFQSIDAATGSAPLFPAYQTDGSVSGERELFDEQTKNGRILGPGSVADSGEVTYYGKRGDAGQKAIEDAYQNGKQIKFWRVDTVKNENDKYDAQFGFAYIESREYSDGVEGAVEISISLQVIGELKNGEIDTLPEEIVNVSKGGYDFQQPGQTTGEAPGTVPAPHHHHHH
uniref:Tail tube protein gp17.1* n=2 Tax=Bacillus phage SPP1 TaxID=10724 RepID=UPI00178D07BE|nr:Chain A, Tail tube protein gp17.1* [Bacillus phage SPP1]6YEG_B Chain B, Tail tube protein gp17.1* [Bacillus phage SPP1]6YEG_C Chain C, Tail tube protein gp17.1* [Bacillus phage SPP1]6YEG_D Chain D, Tail tube protein gp17.1* [Bacillus phage SPP1]6YEG_E Chain E, Tail tube protein gp17.1* [Bacillus phage SPP1]6YEG_F Chain F, Tail tube protein gp17.1* [Bacillus phage SPP1]6YEG_G Chain G, Tail tube protein gp17.1* [Bacillus phage SPP1]6YEG_H Chain H, Tail tube protein gp17.1* [Bacillus phage S